jgi:diguanylate cyclase (GGDEF)-like protein
MLLVIYAVGFVLFAGFAVFVCHSIVRLQWRTRLIRALCLGLLLSLLILLVFATTFGMKDEPGIFFAPFVIVLSIIFILPLWQSGVFITAATVSFLLLSYAYKAPRNFELDVAMGIAGWGLSAIANYEIINLRLRDFRMRCELIRQSSTDCLTGLMNKSTAESAARAYLSRSGTSEKSALFVIDLDQFKQINDMLGHQVGDEALEVIGDTLMKLFRAQDIVGRVGGDEFVVLMKNASDQRIVSRRAALICNTVRQTNLSHYRNTFTCSVGVAICPTHGITYDMLFHKADEQLYEVKRNGKNGFQIAQ